MSKKIQSKYVLVKKYLHRVFLSREEIRKKLMDFALNEKILETIEDLDRDFVVEYRITYKNGKSIKNEIKFKDCRDSLLLLNNNKKRIIEKDNIFFVHEI